MYHLHVLSGSLRRHRRRRVLRFGDCDCNAMTHVTCACIVRLDKDEEVVVDACTKYMELLDCML